MAQKVRTSEYNVEIEEKVCKRMREKKIWRNQRKIGIIKINLRQEKKKTKYWKERIKNETSDRKITGW